MDKQMILKFPAWTTMQLAKALQRLIEAGNLRIVSLVCGHGGGYVVVISIGKGGSPYLGGVNDLMQMRVY